MRGDAGLSKRESRMGRERGHVTIGGVRLETLWIGPPPSAAPTLVFLHEGLGCVEMWRDFPEKLATTTGCGALIYSRSGYGRSDPCPLPRPTDYMDPEGLDVLPAVMDAFHIRDGILIGHSDGGSIGIIYAGGTAATPLRGLITEAAHLFCEDLSVHSIEKAKAGYQTGNLRRGLEKYHGRNTDGAFWGWNDVWLSPDFRKWDISSYLPDIRVPMLVIQGEDDQYGTRAQVSAIARHAGAGARVEMIPGCDHWPHLEKPEMTLELMAEYIGRTLA